MGSYQIKDTKTGRPTLIFLDAVTIRLHSAFDPVTEAERGAAAVENGRASHIIVSGLGLGYHAAALKKKYPDTVIIILERDAEAVRLARKHCPENISGAHIINSKNEGFFEFFEGFDINSFKGIAHYIHRPSYQIEPDFYDELTEAFKEQISSRVSDMLTRFEFEERWIKNIFANLHHLTSSLPVSKLFRKFIGCPGIIVSAGPSLRKNIAQLKELKNKAVIVCVDTAYKVCVKSRITPHIVMTIDAQKHSVKHFLGVGCEALLLADMVSCPAILRSYNGHKALSATAKFFTDSKGRTTRETTPIMDWIEKSTPSPGDIQSGGSVATSAFDLLLNMGCAPIILAGQDLAYTGREIHSAGTHHNDDWLPSCTRLKNLDTINQSVIRRRSISRAEAYGGHGSVITDFVLGLYRGWFQDSSERVPFAVINATEGGARIKNTIEKPLAALAAELPDRGPTETIAGILKSGQAAPLGKLIDELQKAAASLDKIDAIIKSDEQEGIAARIDKLIESTGVGGLINPFLRRTRFYINRQNLDAEKAAAILLTETGAAVQKLIPMIAKAMKMRRD
ncbi:MAG: DUF115 domain-containing protein [Spirochaetia bacterium]|jgi:hypothetical protein|nr:DUF115 domain-containing protein [Spirochaetia bacterium]